MDRDLTIHHTLPRDPAARVQAPCIWCGGPTPVRAIPPFRPDLGALPLHLVCGVEMRDAYKVWTTDRTKLSMAQAVSIAGMIDRISGLKSIP